MSQHHPDMLRSQAEADDADEAERMFDRALRHIKHLLNTHDQLGCSECEEAREFLKRRGRTD